MSSTESLRKDHHLIEKMIKSLEVIIELFKSEKEIPEEILRQTIDFTTNFTNVCHHGKEEESLFPSLEKNGMPKDGGPIARMLYEHKITDQLTDKIKESFEEYVKTKQNEKLIKDIQNYIDHVSSHLMKENFRLFVMADMMLKNNSEEITEEMKLVEEKKLKGIGKDRKYYENIVTDIESKLKK